MGQRTGVSISIKFIANSFRTAERTTTQPLALCVSCHVKPFPTQKPARRITPQAGLLPRSSAAFRRLRSKRIIPCADLAEIRQGWWSIVAALNGGQCAIHQCRTLPGLVCAATNFRPTTSYLYYTAAISLQRSEHPLAL